MTPIGSACSVQAPKMSPLSTGSPQSNIEYWFNLPALISEHARFNDSTLQENKQGRKKKRVLFISRKHCEFCSLEKGNIDFCKTVPSTHIPPFQHHQEHLPAYTSGLNVLKHTSATQMHAWSRNLNVSFSNWTLLWVCQQRGGQLTPMLFTHRHPKQNSS